MERKNKVIPQTIISYHVSIMKRRKISVNAQSDGPQVHHPGGQCDQGNIGQQAAGGLTDNMGNDKLNKK